MNQTIRDYKDAVIAGRLLNAADAARLIDASDDDAYPFFAAANDIRQHYKGRVVSLCSIINARSGTCSENCAFCAQSAHHKTKAEAYPLLDAESIARAANENTHPATARFGIVTSGKGPGRGKDFDVLCKAVRKIDRVIPCASLGTLDDEQAAALREAGLKRYHHNLETARSFFPHICTTHDYDARVNTVKAARKAGMEVCCGGIFGLGENWSHRIEMALEIRSLDVQSVPINFLNPVPGTPLENMQPLPALDALRIISLYRFLLPEHNIRTCGGRGTCLGDLQSWMFYAGSNATMIGNYLTTPNRPIGDDLKMIRDLGFTIQEAEC